MSENSHIRHAGTPYCYANELACHIFRGLKREEEKKKQQKPLHLETVSEYTRNLPQESIGFRELQRVDDKQRSPLLPDQSLLSFSRGSASHGRS